MLLLNQPDGHGDDENRPFEVLDLDLFHDLPVEGVLESPSHFHAVFDISPALMMMYTMEPKHMMLLGTMIFTTIVVMIIILPCV